MSQGSREQLAIAEFAGALLLIPKTLAVNAAKDSTDLVAKLRSYHNAAQNAPAGDPKKILLRYGLDLMNGEVRDNVAAGVLEPTMSKVKSLKSAYEAAVSLLRIDDAIQCLPGKSHQPRHIIWPYSHFFSRTKGRRPPRPLVVIRIFYNAIVIL